MAASIRGGKGLVPVGSTQWITNEQEQIAQFQDEQVDDFAFSARNDFEWLNEHMSEIFSENQLNVTEIFKTPGKLRGKTPRTARKRNPLEGRAPLTDIFSSDIRFNKSPLRPIENSASVSKKPASPIRIASPEKIGSENKARLTKSVADSGYHGITDDEMETEIVSTQATEDKSAHESQQSDQMHLDSGVDVEMGTRFSDEKTEENSFHSARENLTTREIVKEDEMPVTEAEKQPLESYPINPASPPKPETADNTNATVTEDTQKTDTKDAEADLEAAASSSDASTPEKPILRKSSLNFASLPAREPLGTKKSFGNRVSRTSQLETAKNTALNGGSYFGRFTGGKSLGAVRPAEEEDMMDLDDADRPGLTREESDGDGKMAQLHSKSSTQRLHEKINLLGKTQQPRPTKSIPPSVLPTQAQTEVQRINVEGRMSKGKESPKPANTKQSVAAVDDEEDWILPPSSNNEALARPQLAKSHSVDVMEQVHGLLTISGAQLGMGSSERDRAANQSPQRGNEVMPAEDGDDLGLRKAISTTALPSPSKPMVGDNLPLTRPISVSNPTPAARHHESTTPPGSPPKTTLEGHLSASKSKLQSIMKSARSLFSSSAGASAQARMEALSPNSMKLRMQQQQGLGGIDEILGAASSNADLYPQLSSAQATLPESPPKGRKTRSSTEKEREERRKEKESRDRNKMDVELDKAREQERQKAAKFKEQMQQAAVKVVNKSVEDVATLEKTSKPIRQSPRRLAKEEKQQEESVRPTQMAPPARPGTAGSQTVQKGKEPRRPLKPAKDAIAKPRAPPVSIRVGTMSQRVNTMPSNVPETVGPPARPHGPTKKGSNASIQTNASNTSFKSSASSQTTKPKALIAAERKKELDEREALRKLEQKREIERKRAAAQEEAHRREQKQREEAERQREKERAIAAEQEAKRLAHKREVEKRRLDMKKEQQQREAQRAAAAAAELDNAMEVERSKLQSNAHRADLGTSKPSRMDKIQDFPRPPGGYPAVNPAKPPIKRIFDPDNDDELSRPARPHPGQNYQANDSKRRKTEEDELAEPAPRPTMAPPVRQSGIRKMPNPSGYKAGESSKTSIFHNYQAGSSSAHGTQSVFKSSTNGQTYQGYHGASRPGNPIDMAKYTSGKIPFAEAPNPPATAYKTPHQTHKLAPPSTQKSSPGFINGEHIHLDEIPTDSEDEDSEDERDKKSNMPDWVRTPNLFQNLSEQERLNPDAVFGPIAPLNMEEMFKDKSRHQKFRNRTSSANWFGADRLTEDDIRNDMAARDKLRKDGGWTYGLGKQD